MGREGKYSQPYLPATSSRAAWRSENESHASNVLLGMRRNLKRFFLAAAAFVVVVVVPPGRIACPVRAAVMVLSVVCVPAAGCRRERRQVLERGAPGVIGGRGEGACGRGDVAEAKRQTHELSDNGRGGRWAIED